MNFFTGTYREIFATGNVRETRTIWKTKMDVVGQDRDGKKISDMTRLFRLPVKNKVHCMRSLKVQVKIMLIKLIESNFFTSSGLMHPISTSTVLLRTGSDSEIIRLLPCHYGNSVQCHSISSVSSQTDNSLPCQSENLVPCCSKKSVPCQSNESVSCQTTKDDKIKACELD